MRTNDYRNLVDHMEWADALTWASVLGLTSDDRVLAERLYHIHVVQLVYLQAWRGEPMNVPESGRFDDLRAIAGWARPYYAEVRGFIEAASGDALSGVLDIPWAEQVAKRYGSAAPATLGETVLQVVMHSTYHRAQVATRVRELGGEPPVTDYIAWIWQNRPAPKWA